MKREIQIDAALLAELRATAVERGIGEHDLLATALRCGLATLRRTRRRSSAEAGPPRPPDDFPFGD